MAPFVLYYYSRRYLMEEQAITYDVDDNTTEDQGHTSSESVDEFTKEPEKENFRVLYDICLECSYLIPWKTEMHPCKNDPECPAQKFRFVSGRDPEKIIRVMGDRFAKCWKSGNERDFDIVMKTALSDKSIRKHLFSSLAASVRRYQEIAEDEEAQDIKI
jgi:hypothetical protein